MSDRDSKKEELRRKSRESAQKADELLASELETLKKVTTVDLENLKLKITDQETYNKLIAAVQEATKRNESIAQLKQRVEALGKAGIDVAKQVVKVLTGNTGPRMK